MTVTKIPWTDADNAAAVLIYNLALANGNHFTVLRNLAVRLLPHHPFDSVELRMADIGAWRVVLGLDVWSKRDPAKAHILKGPAGWRLLRAIYEAEVSAVSIGDHHLFAVVA